MRKAAIGIVIVVILALSGCTALPAAAPAAAPAPGITIMDPFSRPSPTEGGMGGAFFAVKNGGKEPDRLIAASFAGAQTVELHETVDDNGVMKMRPHPEGWEVPAGGTLELKPGGKHVMLIGLKEPLTAGTQITLVLKFEKAGEITVQVPVKEMGGM